MERNLSTKKTNRTSRHNRIMNLFMVISVGMFIQGCTVGPNYIKPDIETPDIWHEQAVQGLSTGQANLQTWWTNFDDPVLTELINKAGQNNLDFGEEIYDGNAYWMETYVRPASTGKYGFGS